MIYIDLETEEALDERLVKNIFKRYHKALKYTFWKYANTGFNQKEAHSNQRLFEEIKEKV